jgi:hypothetical protein
VTVVAPDLRGFGLHRQAGGRLRRSGRADRTPRAARRHGGRARLRRGVRLRLRRGVTGGRRGAGDRRDGAARRRHDEAGEAPVPGGNFRWHMGFQSVPDVPELLIGGKERACLQWFFEHIAYDPSAIGPGRPPRRIRRGHHAGRRAARGPGGLSGLLHLGGSGRGPCADRLDHSRTHVRRRRVPRGVDPCFRTRGGARSHRRRHRALWPLGRRGTPGHRRRPDPRAGHVALRGCWARPTGSRALRYVTRGSRPGSGR